MIFKVLKSSFDGICGSESRYETIKDVLKEISYFKGWGGIKELHASITKWSKTCRPGDIYPTACSAVVAIAANQSTLQDDICHHCNSESLDYGEIDGVENGNLEQMISCPHCGKQWIDVFGLIERHEITTKETDE